MLANGPACTKAGVPSRVCIRLGLMASFIRTVMRAGHAQVFGGDGFALAGWCRSPSRPGARAYRPGSVVRARMAMISLATVISKPVRRVRPFSSGPRPISISRRIAVVGIHHAPPGDGGGVDIQAGKADCALRGSARWGRSCRCPVSSGGAAWRARTCACPSCRAGTGR